MKKELEELLESWELRGAIYRATAEAPNSYDTDGRMKDIRLSCAVAYEKVIAELRHILDSYK